jgi:hypothetical protein
VDDDEIARLIESEDRLREAVSEWLNWAEGRKTGIAPNGTSWIGYFADKFKEALKP